MRNLVLALLGVLLMNSCKQGSNSTQVRPIDHVTVTTSINHVHRGNALMDDTVYTITCDKDWDVTKVTILKPVIDTISITRSGPKQFISTVVSSCEGTMTFAYNPDSTVREVSINGTKRQFIYDSHQKKVRIIPSEKTRDDTLLAGYLSKVNFFLRQAKREEKKSEK